MSKWMKWLTPWYKEDEADKKDQRVEAAVEASREQIGRSQQVVKSYKEMSILISTLRK